MTSTDTRVHALPVSCDVVVVEQHDFADVALVALIESFGHRVVAAESGAALFPHCRVVVVRAAAQLVSARRLAPAAALVGIGIDGPADADVTSLPDTADSADLLREVLAIHCTAPGQTTDRVHLGRREREVMTTYALGATIYQTARRHAISESTVRSHFRRAAGRYTQAGRTVNNKSQLLIELMADGWIEQPAADSTAS